MNRRRCRRFFCILLACFLLLGCCGSGYAQPETEGPEDQLFKISAPQNGSGMPDGLSLCDRSIGAACAMAERDGKLYIGTASFPGAAAIARLQEALSANGTAMSDELFWAMIDLTLNGALPRPTEDKTGTIVIYNRLTGVFSELVAAKERIRKNHAVQSVIPFKGDLYITTSGCTDGAEQTSQILKLDRNENLTELYYGPEGSSLQASCVMNERLFFGGTDASLLPGELTGGELPAMLTVFCTDGRGNDWKRVADARDFGDCALDPYVKSAELAPISALCAFDGSLWATLPGANGFAVFEGHPAANGEAENDYGWHWTEIVGKNNGRNHPGLAPQPEGYTSEDGGEALLSVCGRLFAFQDQLYVFDEDYADRALTQAAEGLLALGNGGMAAAFIDPIERLLRHPQRLWRLNRESGVFEEITAFSDLLRNSCVEGIVCAQTYQGALYLGTRDCAKAYGCLMQTSGADVLRWSAADWLRELSYLKLLLEQLRPILSDSAQNNKYLIYLNEIGERIDLLMSVLDSGEGLDPETAAYVVENWELILRNIETLLLQLWDEVNANDNAGTDADKDAAGRDIPFETLFKTILGELMRDLAAHLGRTLDWTELFLASFDSESLEKYAYISGTLLRCKQGFDLLKSEDGEHWSLVTDDGFGDPYNDAASCLLETEDGLYVGTQNPWYGAQLWLCGNRSEGACPRDGSCPLSVFSDADPQAWYHDGVHWCVEKGIMNGVVADRFAPNDATTRAQVVTMLWRMAGEPAPGITETAFADVVKGSYYETAVCWAAENGVILGMTPTEFAPNAELSREQLAVILFRYANAEAPAGTDAAAAFNDRDLISNYAREAMCWAVSAGILNGTGNGMLSPKDSATRAQVAAMLLRFSRWMNDAALQ